MGGTMRLGADPVKLHDGTRAREIFDEPVIYKRHRHRYEVNNMLRRRLEDQGLVCGGTSPDERLVEVIELPDHPFFVASQFHPEFNSRPTRPEPKAAVTVLIELAARHVADPARVGLELVFTVAEEDGLRGAKELDLSSLRAPFGFVLDHATPIGEVIVAAPTNKRLIADFTGHEAHAGIKPEEGHSAIAAAAAAIAEMELGRLEEETTANVGMIEGGTASNVVPGHCRICWARPAASTASGRRRRSARWSTPAPGERASGAATWTPRCARCSAATGSIPSPSRCGSPPRRCEPPAMSHGSSSPAAAAMPTRWSPPATRRSCSPTAPRPTTRPTSGSRGGYR